MNCLHTRTQLSRSTALHKPMFFAAVLFIGLGSLSALAPTSALAADGQIVVAPIEGRGGKTLATSVAKSVARIQGWTVVRARDMFAALRQARVEPSPAAMRADFPSFAGDLGADALITAKVLGRGNQLGLAVFDSSGQKVGTTVIKARTPRGLLGAISKNAPRQIAPLLGEVQPTSRTRAPARPAAPVSRREAPVDDVFDDTNDDGPAYAAPEPADAPDKDVNDAMDEDEDEDEEPEADDDDEDEDGGFLDSLFGEVEEDAVQVGLGVHFYQKTFEYNDPRFFGEDPLFPSYNLQGPAVALAAKAYLFNTFGIDVGLGVNGEFSVGFSAGGDSASSMIAMGGVYLRKGLGDLILEASVSGGIHNFALENTRTRDVSYQILRPGLDVTYKLSDTFAIVAGGGYLNVLTAGEAKREIMEPNDGFPGATVVGVDAYAGVKLDLFGFPTQISGDFRQYGFAMNSVWEENGFKTAGLRAALQTHTSAAR